jgi:hypothetical protein
VKEMNCYLFLDLDELFREVTPATDISYPVTEFTPEEKTIDSE